jgi:hypothetical protein
MSYQFNISVSTPRLSWNVMEKMVGNGEYLIQHRTRRTPRSGEKRAAKYKNMKTSKDSA